MNPRTTWLLLGIALALLLIVVVFEPRQRGLEGVAGVPLLPDFEPIQASAVEVAWSNRVIRAERSGNGWRLTQPAYPAETAPVEKLLQVLARARRNTSIPIGEVESQQGGAAAFGLNPPQASVAVVLGTNRVRVNVGAPALVGSQVYAHIAGSKTVDVTDGQLLLALPPGADAWRDARLVTADNPAFDRITITNAGRALELQLDSASRQWRLNKPWDARADGSRVQALLQQLGQTRASRFVSDDPRTDWDALGLQPPEAQLALGQASNEVFSMHFGRSPADDPTQVYARRPGEDALMLLPRQGLLELLAQPHGFFRDRTFFTFAAGQTLDRVEARAEEAFTLQRQTNGAWQIAAPFQALADAELVGRFFNDLQRIEIVDFEADVVTDLAPFGLERPARQYLLSNTVTNATGVTNWVFAELSFSRPAPSRIDRVNARRADEKSVYAVGYGEVQQLPKAAFQLRDRLIWDFPSSNISSVTIQRSGKTRKLAPDPVTGWSKDEVLREAIDETLFRLSRLRAVNWVTRGEDQLRFFAFNHQIALEVNQAGQTRSYAVQLGKLSPSGHVYATTLMEGGKPVVFEFPRELFQNVAQYLSIPDEGASNP